MPKALEQSTPRWTTFSFFLLEHFCDLLENYVHPLVTNVFRSLVGTALSELGFWWHKDSASQQNTSSGSRVLSKEAIKFAGWDLELIWCHHGFLPVQALNRLWTGSFRLLQATSGSFRLDKSALAAAELLRHHLAHKVVKAENIWVQPLKLVKPQSQLRLPGVDSLCDVRSSDSKTNKNTAVHRGRKKWPIPMGFA